MEGAGTRSVERAPASPGAEQTFGARARALEARVLAPLDPRSPRVLFRADVLPEVELTRLDALGSLRIEPAGGLSELQAPREVWESLHEEGFGPLTRAVRNAAAPRPHPRVMGIVNVTPDSFSDGGRYSDPARAVEQGLKLLDEGADILDIGGESTRPGARPVSADEELERVLPVIEGLAGRGVPLSIDTSKARVAREALAAGATMVNDVSAGADPSMFEVVASSGSSICLMHMRGTPRDMQDAPRYADCVREVTAHLRARAARALEAGVAASRLVLDPGIGFGKRLADNLALIRALPELRSLGAPLLLGVSRKSFLGRLTGEPRPDRRGSATAAAVSMGALLGADLHRVHDVAEARKALDVAAALAGPPPDSEASEAPA